KRSVGALEEAAAVGCQIADARSISHARGDLGHLYEEEGRYEEALHLTEQAVFAAQQLSVPELLWRWQWQMGRILRSLQRTEDSIAAYRRAVAMLQSIRQALLIRPGTTQQSFRESVGAAYVELVDLLLRRAALAEERGERDA